MNRSLSKKNKPSYKVVVFWSLIGLLTLAFVGLIVSKFVESRPVNDLDDLINLRENQIFEQTGNYYVYVYSKVGVTEDKYELDKAESLRETILTYLTYEKRNSDAYNMYGMNVDSGSGNYGNYSSLVEGSGIDTSVINKTSFSALRIHKDDIPILLKIEDGKVKSAYLTENDIRKELQSAMGIE